MEEVDEADVAVSPSPGLSLSVLHGEEADDLSPSRFFLQQPDHYHVTFSCSNVEMHKWLNQICMYEMVMSENGWPSCISWEVCKGRLKWRNQRTYVCTTSFISLQ